MKSDHNWLQQGLQRLKRLRTRRNAVLAASVTLGIAVFAATVQFSKTRQTAALAYADTSLDALPVVPENMRWGFAVDEFQLTEAPLKSGDILGEMLMKQGLTYPQVNRIVEQCKGKFNINSMRIGRKLNFLAGHEGQLPAYMIYEPSPYEYVLFNLKEPYNVEVVKRQMVIDTIASSGVLETSFWQALMDNGLDDQLADGMIDILASSVDFYHQKQGDRFKVVYEQHIVEGEPVGTGKIIAAVYEREGKEYYAFNFEKPGEKTNYFDFDGRPARKAFLKSPLKYSRISSRYNLHRLHPILGYHKAHLGTDYAAPQGTPIMSVAEGTVVEAGRKGGNGNYVKIRHDGVYQTQYLHMSGFAKGIRPGTRVAQGQTIGYVGSTGLATGPHVCFRFWKNGREVDHLRLNLPQPEPIKGAVLEEFIQVRNGLIQMLNGVEYRTHEQIVQEHTEEEKPVKAEP
ncbi:MAG TPA: peptidoglycan DD-metalloendopeptidase family protein [Saprospiraceae bacterium]|nr:peptidoglycan DD-metalloendopeptidase family protein [Saprospiraceae bacterium]